MTGPCARLLSQGRRLHLQHGPIDLVIGADGPDGAREAAFAAARRRFATILQELVDELDLLRAPLGPGSAPPRGETARRMHAAALPFAPFGYLTRMAAVAGAVADTILAAMRAAAPLERAHVNDGGDIALHLAPGRRYAAAMALADGREAGRIEVAAGDGIGGIATSGRHGRSLSLGIADSVTVLARDGASADTAATLIANAVDLPGHPAIRRQPACEIHPDSDLGAIPVVTGCRRLAAADRRAALAAGARRAEAFLGRGLIAGAALFLAGDARLVGPHFAPIAHRRSEDA